MFTISDSDLSFGLDLDASDGISSIDDFSNSLGGLEDAAAHVASGISSSMDSAVGSLGSVQDAADMASSSLAGIGDVDTSGAVGGMNDLSDATKTTAESASATVGQFDLLDAIELAGIIAAVDKLATSLDACLGNFASLNDISTRSAMFGGAGTSGVSLESTTEAIQKQAQAVGLKLGMEPAGVAAMEGVLRQYQVDTSKMSNDQIGQYVALARTTKQDPSAVAAEVLKTSKAFNISDTQKVIDVAAQAYGQTGFDFSSAQMSLSKMAGEQTQKALGGLTGEMAILQDLQQTTLPSRGAGIALNKAVEDWQNSSDSYKTQVEKINAKGKVSYSTKDVKAEGMVDTKTGESIFSEAGLDTTLEKNKSFMDAMSDLYTQGKEKGVDYFASMSGGMYLEELAKNRSVIQGYQTENENASGANDKLKKATDDLEVSLKRIGESFTIVGENIGSLMAGPAKQFADWITGPALTGVTSFIDSIKSGDIVGAFDDLFGKALDYLNNLDYNQIGQDLHNWLIGGWQVATTLFGQFMSSDTELTGAFTAIADVLMPTFNDIFGSLQGAGIDAWNAIGRGATTLENAIGGGLTGAVRFLIDAFADLAGAADDALGGALSSALGLKDAVNGTGTGTTQTTPSATPMTPTTAYPSWVAPQDIAKAKKTGEYWDSVNQIFINGEEMSASAPGRYTLASMGNSKELTTSEKVNQRQLESAGNEIYGGNSGTQRVIISEPVKIDTSGMKTQSMSDLNANLGVDENGTPNNPKAYAAYQANPTSLGQAAYDAVMTIAVAKEGNLPGITATNQQAASDIAKIPIEQQTSTQKALAAGIDNTQKITGGLSDLGKTLIDAGKVDSEKSGQTLHDAILTKYSDPLKWDETAHVWTDIQKITQDQAADTKKIADGVGTLPGALLGIFNKTTTDAATAAATAAVSTGNSGSQAIQYPADSENGMFFSSYIGRSGPEYDAFLKEESARGANHPAVDQLDAKYQIDADMSPADAKKATFENSVASANPTMTVGIDTTNAMSEVNKLITWVITSRPVMTVQVQISAVADDIWSEVDKAISAKLNA